MIPTSLRTYSITVHAEAYEVDILGDNGGYGYFTQISNIGPGSLTIRVNGSPLSDFPLESSETQIFQGGELIISKLTIINESGADQSIRILTTILQAGETP